MPFEEGGIFLPNRLTVWGKTLLCSRPGWPKSILIAFVWQEDVVSNKITVMHINMVSQNEMK